MPQRRLYFIDNLRYLCVWCVVIFHTSVGYIGLPEFYVETETAQGLQIIRHAIVLFTLPMLFLLSGYFALPALDKRGTFSFLKNKLARLGIPFLIGIVLLGPLMPYLGYYAQSFRGLPTDSYWYFWTHYIGSGLTNLMLPAVFTTQPNFHHQHFYFLALLLEFMIILAMVRPLLRRWRPPANEGLAMESEPGFSGAFLALAIGVPLFHFLVSRLPGFSGEVAFLFYYSTGDAVLFGGAFLLGIHAWKRRWFQDGRVPGWKPLAVLGVTFLLLHQGSGFVRSHQDAIPAGLLVLEQGLAASFAVWLTTAGVLVLGYWLVNRQSAFNSEMAAVSYDIYVLQYPVILALRCPLLTWQASAWIKFALVVPLTIFICWALSRFVIRPHPRAAIAGAVLLTAALCLFGLPRWGDSHLLLDRRAELTAVVPEPEARRVLENPSQAVRNALGAVSVGPADRFGELFRADRRYGKPRQEKEPDSNAAFVVDHDGNAFVATSLGVQVFNASGRLLGLITFPDLMAAYYYPPKPSQLAIGGPGESTLYIACGDQVYAVRLGSSSGRSAAGGT